MSATNIAGLSDCAGSVFGESARCPCGSVARVACGLCVNCLLQQGLAAEKRENEAFEEVLAEIDVRDNDWQLGNYQILEEIGRGGMGVIYRARQRHSRRIVALKRVLTYHSDSQETLTRFQREAEAAASLDHPNILPIYEVALSESGLPFFSMKFASGGSLLQAKSGFREHPRKAVQLLAKVVRAVAYAHSQGILHRDLKPGNILLDGRGDPLVSDFGLAKWIEATSDLTRTMTVFGTPGYIAPEQVRCPAEGLTAAVDIYSLGAILFELLSGRPPFLAEHAIAVIHQAAEKQAPKLRSIAPALPRDLETICARCLEREPKARYQSAGVLADDLERWLEGRPISARPVCAPVRLWRWSRRNPRLATAVGACAMLGLAALGRQYQTHRLEKALWNNTAASHSITVLPFLDLDEIRPDPTSSRQMAELLQSKMSIYGPCRIIAIQKPVSHRSGSALQEEIHEASSENKSRMVLSGTRRRLGSKVRLSFHLIADNGADVLGNWVLEISAADTQQFALATAELGTALYKQLYAGANTTVTEDPVMANERARKFFVAGRDLISRRTIAELDRAVSCLENALREEPRSIDTRAFLAMACMGRDTLCTNPGLASRAIEVAREAVQLAPDSPTAHRAACAVVGSYGHYREALEHGFQSIEFGDRSERAFGQIAYGWKMLGRPDLAILWYKKAKLSQHQPADYDALMGDCWADLTADRSAELEYESATSFHPDQPDGWLGLCRLKLLAGDTETARQIYRAELPHYPDFAVAKEVAAMVEFFGRNFAAATQLYIELAQADPLGGGRGQFYGAIDYRSALGRLKIESNDKTGGRELLQQSVLSSKAQLLNAPDDFLLLYHLAAAEASLGETAASLEHLRSAVGAGWVDYRSAQLDPRFDSVSRDPQFQNILSELAASVATLRRRSPAASANGE
jgi:serine/threonine protein kinase